MLAMYLGSVATFLMASVLYVHGRFRLAGLCGAIHAILLGLVVAGSMGTVTAALLLALLLVAPDTFLLVHAVDVRRGMFLFPTIYSIPIAFFCGALLLLVSGIALAL